VEQIRRYIELQEEHHRTRSFKDEFLEFLNRYEIEYDERFLWD
jgi:putative transposase